MVSNDAVSSRVFNEDDEANQNDLAVSVVVPTRNEAGNVRPLLTAIRNAFYGRSIEVVFVDDSTDETPKAVLAAAEEFPFQHVTLIHRAPEERAGGLGTAVVLGLRSARAEYACVMDGDLQHPPEVGRASDVVPSGIFAAADNVDDASIGHEERSGTRDATSSAASFRR